MYFWRIEELKTKMADHPLSEREVLPYVVLCAALNVATCYLPGENINIWKVLEAACNILVAAFGSIYIYQRNGGANGKHFLQRYFVIGWVVTVRWFVGLCAFGVLVIIYFACLSALAGHDKLAGLTNFSSWYWCLLGIFIQTVLYLNIAHHVGDLAQRTETDGLNHA